MRDAICGAIGERRLLKVRYGETERVVEPYLLFETRDGALVLHSWQVEGVPVAGSPEEAVKAALGDRHDSPAGAKKGAA